MSQNKRLVKLTPVNIFFKDTRLKHNYTQEQFASILGIPRPRLASYEEGRSTPGYPVLKTLVDAFNIDKTSLYDILYTKPESNEQ